MPVFKPKSPEILQAQAAAFAAEYVGYGDGRDLAQEIGNASVGMEVSFDTSPSQRESVMSSREREYLQFLRENEGQQDPSVSRRAEMLIRYAEFEPAVEEILSELEDIVPKNWREHPNHIGCSGRTSDAFVIEHGGQDYVLRVPREEGFGIDREYIVPALKSQGDEAMEQMVAISYEKDITISELIPGRTIEEMSPEEMAKIKEEHLYGLVDTLTRVQAAGLTLDANPGNTLYDPETGFGMIDLSDSRFGLAFNTSGGSIDAILNDGANVLLSPLRLHEKRIDTSVAAGFQAERDIIALYSIFIPIIAKYKTICEEKFADDERLPMIENQLNAKLKTLIGMKQSAERSLLNEAEAEAVLSV